MLTKQLLILPFYQIISNVFWDILLNLHINLGLSRCFRWSISSCWLSYTWWWVLNVACGSRSSAIRSITGLIPDDTKTFSFLESTKFSSEEMKGIAITMLRGIFFIKACLFALFKSDGGVSCVAFHRVLSVVIVAH